MFRLFLLFTLVPVIELTLLIEVGGAIGPLPTIGLCLLTGFVGAALARSQGAGVLRRLQETIAAGGLPAREILDGVLILIAGVVLLTPGFVTDAVGLLLLMPLSRAVVRGLLMRWVQGRLVATATQGPHGAAWTYTTDEEPRAQGEPEQMLYPPGTAPSQAPPRRRPKVIEIE